MRRYGLAAVIFLGLVLRVGYAVAIYEPSLLNYNLDDFTSYSNAASDILQGDLAFTNSLYMKRPPLYSLLVAALQIQPVLVIAANIILGTVIIPLTFLLAWRCGLSHEFALVAALIIAIDAASIRQSANLRADALASFLLAFAFPCLLHVKRAEAKKAVATLGSVTGGFIMLSAFARPVAYLLWVPMALWLVFSRERARLLAALALAILPVLGVAAWQAHNAVYFHNGSFSSAGTFQLLYVRAASVLHQATGKDINFVYAELARRVEEDLGNEAEDITAAWRHRHLASTAEMQGIMTDIAVDIFFAFPLYYILTIPVGIYRALLTVSVWPFWLGIGWNILLLAVASHGLLNLLRLRQIILAAFLAVPCLYFLTGTLLVATASFDTRARVMVTPLIAIMAAHGLVHLFNQRRAPSACP